MSNVFDLMRKRISQGACPVCGQQIGVDFKVILDKNISDGDIRICRRHEYPQEGGLDGRA